MKVWMVCPYFSSRKFGGAETHVYNLSEALSASGIAVSIHTKSECRRFDGFSLKTADFPI